MHRALKDFVHQYLGVIAASLVPVILTAFVSMPVTLARHPGEAVVTATLQTGAEPAQTMTR